MDGPFEALLWAFWELPRRVRLGCLLFGGLVVAGLIGLHWAIY